MDLYKTKSTPKALFNFSADKALINDFRSYCAKNDINMSYVMRESMRRFLIRARDAVNARTGTTAE